MYLCNGPFHKRTTSQTGTVNFLKVVVRVAEVLADHYLADVISKMERKRLIIVSDLGRGGGGGGGLFYSLLFFRGTSTRMLSYPVAGTILLLTKCLLSRSSQWWK